MINFIKNLFRTRESNPLVELRATEDHISKILSGTDIPRKDFADSQQREGEHRAELNALTTANPDLQISNKNVENEAAAKRLKRRKWFTVIIEAILAISAVRLFFSETVNVSGLPMLTTVLLGLVVAYAVLDVAINFKIDDAKIESTGFMSLWYRFSWLLPLLLIPFLNFYNVMSHPGNPTNMIWVFFALLSIWLNIKCAGYSKQFELMKNTAIAEKKTRPHLEGLKSEGKIQNRINRHMLEIKRQLMKPAADLKRIYQSFGENKPELTLHPLYCILLNNRYYLYQLLPIHDIEIMNPPKNMSDYLMFWDETTNVPVTVKPVTETLQETDEQDQPVLSNMTEPETVKPAVAREQNVQENTAQQGAPNNAAPAFADVLTNDDEIFV